MIYGKSKSISIIKCVALQKTGQTCKMKWKIAPRTATYPLGKVVHSLNIWGLSEKDFSNYTLAVENH